MTPRTTLLLRRGLLVVVAGVVVAVAVSVRKPAPPPSAPAEEPPAGANATRVGDLVFRRFKGEREGFVLKARSMKGQPGEETSFEGVEVEISYLARGEPGKAKVTADFCRLREGQEHAVFQGHAHVVTEDGFDLRSETLIYDGHRGTVKTTDPVEFRRKTLSGTATGLEYVAETGALDLPADVVLDIDSETGPPVHVRADRASASREEHELRFLGNVKATQGSDSLVAGRLDIDLNEELTAAYRAVAVEDVELRTSGDAPLPGAAEVGKAKGPRILKARKLDLWFREDKTLKEATASPDAELTVMPAPGEVQEKRRIQARVLAFRFDEQGRLAELHAQRDALVNAEPLRAGKGAPAPRTITAGNLAAHLHPATGEIDRIHFLDGVEFRQGGRMGRGQVGRYEGDRGILVLSGEPELRDDVDGTELKAKTIETYNNGDIKAEGSVRQTRKAKPGGKGGFLSGDEAVTVIVADRLDYQAQDRRARYEGKALLRSGTDEVRGQTLVLEEPAPEKRRLVATGEVVSRFTPRASASSKEGSGKEGPAKETAAVEGRAGKMVYEAERGEIVYTDAVTIRQGDIKTTSPRATLRLTRDGRDLETLIAGEPAEIEQGTRKAKGARATYTPATETVVIVGDKVVLEDPGQQVEGRSLTFKVGDETILVDGQELVRTEAVIRRDPRRP